MAKKKSGTIFDKVLFIGPDVNNRGGIVAVLRAYRDNLPAFHCLSTNSGKGFIPGIINLFPYSSFNLCSASLIDTSKTIIPETERTNALITHRTRIIKQLV